MASPMCPRKCRPSANFSARPASFSPSDRETAEDGEGGAARPVAGEVVDGDHRHGDDGQAEHAEACLSDALERDIEPDDGRGQGVHGRRRR